MLLPFGRVYSAINQAGDRPKQNICERLAGQEYCQLFFLCKIELINILEVAIYSSRINITTFGRVYTVINLAGDRPNA